MAILSKAALLSGILSLGSVLPAQSQSVFQGYVAADAGFVRVQSNANLDLVKGWSNKVTLQLFDTEVVFVNDKASLNPSSLNFESIVHSVTTFPFPKVVTRRTTATIGGQTLLAANSSSQAVTFPFAFEYNEVNNVDGFQLGNDTVVQAISLNDNVGLFQPKIWSPLQVGTEVLPGLNGSVPVTVVTSCNRNNGYCFEFRTAPAMYIRNGQTFLPDSVKVDVVANLTNFKTANGRLALLSIMRSTQDSLDITDKHKEVDAVKLIASGQAGAVAMCSPDFVTRFNAQGTASAYVNFARSASLSSGASNQTVGVNAQVLANLTVEGFLQVIGQVTKADVTIPFDAKISGMINLVPVVYSFLGDANNATTLTWDPEVGIADVSLTNKVVAPESPKSTAPATIAGIAVGAIAVIGIAGFAGIKIYKRKHNASENKTARV